MQLIAQLTEQLAAEESYFRQHLLKEDIVRLERLQREAASMPDADEFVTAAMKIGWTPDDRRTPELRPSLEPFLRAVHARLTTSSDADGAGRDRIISELWQAFDRHRLERLVGCLTRVPQPE